MQPGGAASGKKQGEQGSRGPKRGLAKGGPERHEARQRGQTALAVQGAIAAGTRFLLHVHNACRHKPFRKAAGSLGLLVNILLHLHGRKPCWLSCYFCSMTMQVTALIMQHAFSPADGLAAGQPQQERA